MAVGPTAVAVVAGPTAVEVACFTTLIPILRLIASDYLDEWEFENFLRPFFRVKTDCYATLVVIL